MEPSQLLKSDIATVDRSIVSLFRQGTRA
jgi:hypothetical protein